METVPVVPDSPEVQEEQELVGRAVMILGPIQGHSYEQMARILGTSEEVIKARLHRARENIREYLKDDR